MVNFVILGCPRSGTTLLATLLEKNFDVAAPIEPHIVEYFGRYRWIFRGKLPRWKKELIVNSIYRFLKIWLPRNNPARPMSSVIPYSLLATEVEKERMIESGEDFDSLLRAIFEFYAQKHGTSGWVDKSAYYYPPNIQIISNILSNAKFIHIRRDPFDTCASWHKSWFGPPHFLEAGRLWKKHIKKIAQWSKDNPGDLFEIEYEDLTLNPEKTIESISHFFGEPLQRKQTPTTKMSSVLSEGGTHDNLASAVVHAPGKWMPIYSTKEAKELAIITNSAPPEETSQATTYSLTDRASAKVKQYYWLARSQFVIKVMLRKIKYILPAYCFIVELATPPRSLDK